MQQRTQQPLTWSALLTALSASEGDVVIIRDGTNRVPSGLVGTRAAADDRAGALSVTRRPKVGFTPSQQTRCEHDLPQQAYQERDRGL